MSFTAGTKIGRSKILSKFGYEYDGPRKDKNLRTC